MDKLAEAVGADVLSNRISVKESREILLMASRILKEWKRTGKIPE